MGTPRLHRARVPWRRAGLVPPLVVLLVVGVAAVWFYHAIYAPLSTMTSQIVPTPSPVVVSSTSVAAPRGVASQDKATVTAVAVPTAPPPPTPTATPLPALGGNQRINILLLGSDTDRKFADNGIITQIMIVATIDPVHRTIGLLSIPRDFWVPIPGHGINKIQDAYQFGEKDHANGGGVALARETVQDDFGIHIDHYAWVGLEGFIKVVDTAGGVDVDALHPILDDEFPDDIVEGQVSTVDIYASRRLYLPAGPQHMDGTTALEYVRSRHADRIGDFGRSQRQQQVLLNLRHKVEQPGTILRIPEYLNDLTGYVRSDFSVAQLPAYATFIRQQANQPITQVVLMPPDYSSVGTSADGQSIVVPNWKAVRTVTGRLFTSPQATATPAAQLDGPTSVEVENGTTIGGLATRATEYLRELGYTVAPPRDATRQGQASTVVTVYAPEKRGAADMLALLFGGSVQEAGQGVARGEADIVVTLGVAHGTFEGV